MKPSSQTNLLSSLFDIARRTTSRCGLFHESHICALRLRISPIAAENLEQMNSVFEMRLLDNFAYLANIM